MIISNALIDWLTGVEGNSSCKGYGLGVRNYWVSCYSHDHQAPNIMRLAASKKVLHIHVPQGAAKLQTVKLFSFFKNYTFLVISHNVIWKQRHLWTLLIFFRYQKFVSLQLCSPLCHMDKKCLFGSLQSYTVWIQVFMGVAGL